MGVAPNSLFVGLDSVDCVFVAPVMVAPLTRKVDHFREFVFAATSWLISLEAAACESLAPVVAAPSTPDIYESMLFAVHRTTCRRLPLRTITRLFLYREAFYAISSHIIPKYISYVIHTWP